MKILIVVFVLVALAVIYYASQTEPPFNDIAEYPSLRENVEDEVFNKDNPVTEVEDLGEGVVVLKQRILVTHDEEFDIPEFQSEEEEVTFMKKLLLSNSGFIESDLKASGFSTEGASALALGEGVISIKDMAPELKDISLDDLKNYNDRGYWQVDELFADEISSIMNYIIGIEHESANIDFSLTAVPEYFADNFEYLGFTHPNYSTNPDIPTLMNGTVRRVFSKLDTSSFMVLEESSNSESGRVVLTQEYVNTSVNGRPAILQTKKSQSGIEFVSLHWVTEKHSFNLYQVGDLVKAPDNLMQAAIELDKQECCK